VTAAAPVADATSTEDVVAQLNALMASLRTAGLLAVDD
jgi:flagellar motor component MotA